MDSTRYGATHWDSGFLLLLTCFLPSQMSHLLIPNPNLSPQLPTQFLIHEVSAVKPNSAELFFVEDLIRLNHLTIYTSIQMFCVLGSCLVGLCFQSLSISSRLSNLLMYKCS